MDPKKMNLKELMPESWRTVLKDEFDKPYFAKLEELLAEELATDQKVYPPLDEVFAAFHHTSYDAIKILLLGQDPYHGPGQAHGLSFSVKPPVKPPPSLRNMFKELKSDIDCSVPNNGDLTPWAKQGILLLNAVLTVRHKTAASHKKFGWMKFTDAVIKAVNARQDPVVFLLWGGFAKKKIKHIDADRHIIIQGTHPSPLSARNGFFGSKPFSAINNALVEMGKEPIDWQLPNL